MYRDKKAEGMRFVVSFVEHEMDYSPKAIILLRYKTIRVWIKFINWKIIVRGIFV